MKHFLKDIIQEAGKLSLQYRVQLDRLSVEFKTETQLVTEADRAVEEFLIGEIKKRYPEHAIFAEESGAQGGNEYCWFIDPIDGTTSFVHGQPFYTVSIGLEKSGQAVMGAVYLPVMDELFEAEKGGGATCNGKVIRVSSRAKLSESVLGTSLGCIGHGPVDDNLIYFGRVKPQIRNMRNYGSASMHLCYVAAGRFEGYWQLDTAAYDVCAGFLLVAEAGGRFSDFTGGAANLGWEVVATNGLIHDELIAILSAGKNGA